MDRGHAGAAGRSQPHSCPTSREPGPRPAGRRPPASLTFHLTCSVPRNAKHTCRASGFQNTHAWPVVGVGVVHVGVLQGAGGGGPAQAP